VAAGRARIAVHRSLQARLAAARELVADKRLGGLVAVDSMRNQVPIYVYGAIVLLAASCVDVPRVFARQHKAILNSFIHSDYIVLCGMWLYVMYEGGGPLLCLARAAVHNTGWPSGVQR
jgi:hypothetical protein